MGKVVNSVYLDWPALYLLGRINLNMFYCFLKQLTNSKQFVKSSKYGMVFILTVGTLREGFKPTVLYFSILITFKLITSVFQFIQTKTVKG